MTPTNELRFVSREIDMVVVNSGFEKHVDHLGNIVTTVRQPVCVLQQKWVDTHDKFAEGEWRDVPLVKEES